MRIKAFEITGAVDAPPRKGSGSSLSGPMRQVLAAVNALKDGQWLELQARVGDKARSAAFKGLRRQGYKVAERLIDGTVHIYIRKPPVEMVHAD